MPLPYYVVVTAVGLAKLAACATDGGHLALSQMAVGDGGGAAYAPTDQASQLVRETYRSELHNVQIDVANTNWVRCEMVIPPQVGGWYVRECGLYDADGDLIAVGSYPPTYKPVLNDGSSIELIIRMVIEITNVETVQLTIDASTIWATQSWVLAITNNIHSLPPGGKAGDHLIKATDTDYDATWRAQRRINPYSYFIGQF